MGDIVTGLFARYSCNDAADGTITDSGPNGLNLPVTASGAFPTRTATPGRLFSRDGLTGSSSTATNYARLIGIAQATYQQIAGGPMTISFWHRRATAGAANGGNSTGSDRLIELAGDGSGTSASKAAFLIFISFTRTATPQYSIGWSKPVGTALPADASALTSQLVDGLWAHYVFVLAAGTAGNVVLTIYKNGVKQIDCTELPQPYHWTLPPDAGGLSISRDVPSANGQVGGELKDVRLYSRALASGDVTDLLTADPPLDNIDPSSITQAQTFGTPSTLNAASSAGAISVTVSLGTPRVANLNALTTQIVLAVNTAAHKSSAPVPTATTRTKAVLS